MVPTGPFYSKGSTHSPLLGSLHGLPSRKSASWGREAYCRREAGRTGGFLILCMQSLCRGLFSASPQERIQKGVAPLWGYSLTTRFIPFHQGYVGGSLLTFRTLLQPFRCHNIPEAQDWNAQQLHDQDNFETRGFI